MSIACEYATDTVSKRVTLNRLTTIFTHFLRTNSTLVLSKLLNVSRLQSKEASTGHLRLTKRSAGNGMDTCDFSRNGSINKNSFSPFAEEIDDDPHR